VQGLLKSAIWGWLAGIPKRIGFTPAREQASRFYTHTHASFDPLKSQWHASQEFLSLLTLIEKEYAVPSIGHLQYPMPANQPMELAKFFPEGWLENRESKPLIALAPCTAWASKQWGVQHWITLAQQLIQAGFRVVWVGSPTDQSFFTPIWEAFPLEVSGEVATWVSWVGETTLSQLYQLFSEVDCLVGADSVAFHLATASSRNSSPHHHPKIVGLFGATKPSRTGATSAPHEGVALMLETAEPLTCKPCHQRVCPLKNPEAHMACMVGLPPETVLETVMQLLGKTA
jgi:ADP-heptose:LPS heptosyltransferase